MQADPSVPWWTHLLPLVVVVALLAIRLARPQRISVTRMWIGPSILIALTGWAIYATQRLEPAPTAAIVVALTIGAIAGFPFGVLRGRHTEVRPTQRRGVMYLGTSWATVAIFLAAFGLRAGVRALMPHRGGLSAAIGDALLAFAIAFIATSYVFIYRKYQVELAAQAAISP